MILTTRSSSWTAVDQSRYLLGDSFGRLSMLSLGTDGMILIPLGQVRSIIPLGHPLTYCTLVLTTYHINLPDEPGRVSWIPHW